AVGDGAERIRPVPGDSEVGGPVQPECEAGAVVAAYRSADGEAVRGAGNTNVGDVAAPHATRAVGDRAALAGVGGLREDGDAVRRTGINGRAEGERAVG